MTNTNVTNTKSAVVAIIGSMAVLGIIDNSIAVLAREIGLWQFQMLRSVIAFPLLIVVTLFGVGTIWPQRWRWVITRNLIMACAMMFYFGALAFLPISQALAGLLTAPLWVVIITAVFRRVSVGPLRYMAVAVGFVGTLLVLDISLTTMSFGTILPICAGLLYAVAQIVTRDYCSQESPIAMLAMITFLQFLFGSAVLVALAWIDPVVPAGNDGFIVRGWVWPIETAWPWIALQAVGSLIGVGLAVRAYQTGEASYVAIFEYSIFIFGLGAAFVLFGSVPNMMQILGIVLIVAAGGIIAFRLR